MIIGFFGLIHGWIIYFLPGSPEGRMIHNTHNRFALFFGLESFFDSCAMGVCIKSSS